MSWRWPPRYRWRRQRRPGPTSRSSMQDGRVTLNAAGATVREILAAWAKVGQTRIVNAERVSGGPVTLHLQDLPEEQALEIILRSVSGYLAAPRANAIANASRYDRIFVMPTSTPPRTAPAPAPQPAFPQPRVQSDDPATAAVQCGRRRPDAEPHHAARVSGDLSSRSPSPVPRRRRCRRRWVPCLRVCRLR